MLEWSVTYPRKRVHFDTRLEPDRTVRGWAGPAIQALFQGEKCPQTAKPVTGYSCFASSDAVIISISRRSHLITTSAIYCKTSCNKALNITAISFLHGGTVNKTPLKAESIHGLYTHRSFNAPIMCTFVAICYSFN